MASFSRDDLESLTYTAVAFTRKTSVAAKASQGRAGVIARDCSHYEVSMSPAALIQRISCRVCRLNFAQTPDYALLRKSFADLEDKMGWKVDNAEPLDWAPCVAPDLEEPTVESVVEITETNEEGDTDEEYGSGNGE
ncbi:hypothetical protein PIIN_07092 [Serendipita indica DSM 11827]|uniref:Uncharacterized protein n=1 Tax=Serendipita indica (strain DSM 11827) TaxID=1109443 RepID=G4TP95_SERID|nr:hypothetical protein PIIN_07092 [Serendipita indica DSM 11827]